MGQKVHPLGFRLGVTKTHQSNWFTTKKKYPIFIEQDRFLRDFLLTEYRTAGISTIQIDRKVNQIWMTLRAANPRLIVGGKDLDKLESLRKDLEEKLHKYTVEHILTQQNYEFYEEEYLEKPAQIAIFVTKVGKKRADVSVLSKSLVDQLEQRVAFRRAIRQAVKQAQRQNVQGIKIQISGRLNGAEIARSEWVREGRVPLQTLRANIDYCYTTAKTIYGLLGIKIWIFRGEKS
jgi:small subunit ribosomal protein S3